MDLFDALGSLIGAVWNARTRTNATGTGPFQAELAAIAGPKTETGYHLPVQIRLRKEPWGAHGPHSMMCLVDGRPVGYLHPDMITDDLLLGYERAALAGEPFVLDGYIVGGWSRNGGKDEGVYRLKFGLDFGESPLDADMRDVLELQD